MTPDASHTAGADPNPAAEFKQCLARARHDLRNPLAHILGFCEMLLEKAVDREHPLTRVRLQAIYQTADALVREVNRCLGSEHLVPCRNEAVALKNRLRREATAIIVTAEELSQRTRDLIPDRFSEDLAIIAGAGRKLRELSETALEFLIAKE